MNLSPLPIQKFFDNNGRPMNGGLLFTYVAGTSTKIATYSNQGGTLNTNPVVLDFRGEAHVWLDPELTYKFVLSPPGDTDPPTRPIWTVDNITAAVTLADLTQQIIGQILWPLSPAEEAVGALPVNWWLRYGCIDRYQTNTTPNSTDMSLGLFTATAVVNAQGGGRITTIPGSVYRIVTSPIILAGCEIDLEGSTFNLAFPAGSDVVGLDFREDCSIHSGTVKCVNAGNPTGGNSVHHCCILLGAADGSGTGYSNFRAYDLDMDSNRSDTVGGTLIYIAATSSNFKIENIRVPDNSTLSAVVREHWQSDGVSPTPLISYHPHNGLIDNIRCGSLTKAATTDVAVVDIVGASNTIVRNIYAATFSGDAVVQIRTGAIGSAVAPASTQAIFCRGIEVTNVQCPSFLNHLVLVNGRAHGVGAIAQADYSIPAIVKSCTGKGAGAGATNGTAGLKAVYVSDTEFIDNEIQQADRGCMVEELCRRVKVEGNRFHRNQKDGLYVGHSNQPIDTEVGDNECWLNNQSNTNRAGIYIESSSGTKLRDNICGDASSETTQFYNYIVADSSSTFWSGRNRSRNVKAGGTEYVNNGPAVGNYSLIGGAQTLSTAATQYSSLSGVMAPQAASVDASALIGQDCLLTNFSVELSAAPNGATKSRTIRIDVNGGATSVDVTITDAATTGVSYDAEKVAAGSDVVVEAQVTNTPDAARARWACQVILI